MAQWRESGKWAVAGSTVGLAAGLAFCLLDVPAAYAAAGGQPSLEQLIRFVRGSVSVVLPLFIGGGAAFGGGLWLVGRLSARLARWAGDLLPLVGTAALFAYAAAWRVEAGGKLSVRFLALSVVAAPLIGGLVSGALGALARRVVGCRRLALCGLLPAAGLLLSGAAFAWRRAELSEPRLPPRVRAQKIGRPNVLLIVLDTVRADHLSCYGYARKTTPGIDALAAESRLYSRAVCPGGWTIPSHASLFTGLPVSVHGCTWANRTLDERFDTLAELLSRAGYQTAGLSSNAILTPIRHFSQGFDYYWLPATRGEAAAEEAALAYRLSRRFFRGRVTSRASRMQGRLAAWFRDDYVPDKPFFVFLNYIEAHKPYIPPGSHLTWASQKTRRKWAARDQPEILTRYLRDHSLLSASDMEELMALYDEEVAYVDGKVGEVLDWLRQVGLLDNTLVVITADHGEQFGEHGLVEHQYSVYEAVVHVPLIVRLPSAFEPGRDERLVQMDDIFPTVLAVAGVDWQPTAANNCRSLLDASGDDRRFVVSEYLAPAPEGLKGSAGDMPALAARLPQQIRAVRVGDAKLIRWSGGDRELYHVDRDPLEAHDLAAAQAEEAAALGHVLDEWLASLGGLVAPVSAQPDLSGTDEELQTLKELGYLR